MKRIIILLLAVIAVISVSSLAFAAERKPEVKVIVYYFHGPFRCDACIIVEQYCREAIEAYSKSALAAGRAEFKAVNVEEKGNEHFVDDYHLDAKSIVLSMVQDGKVLKFKNLESIWEHAGNRQNFLDYLNAEVNAFLEGA